MTTFWLIRHGQTDWNIEGKFQGHTDMPLNQTGREQAYTLAEKIKDQYFSELYTSDLSRALETAQIIARFTNLTPRIDHRLRERSLGEWEGKSLKEVKLTFTGDWEQSEEDPVEFHPPNGESVGECARRIWEVADEIAARPSAGPILIVSHGLALATLICKANSQPLTDVFANIPENVTPVVVDWNVDRKS